MNLSDAPRRPRGESIVPMINVVFLLLIFFLMTSRLAPPEPFEVSPPQTSAGTDASADRILHLDKTGHRAFDGQEGDDAIARLVQWESDGKGIQVRADAEVEAAIVARLLKELAQAGLDRVELSVSPK